MISLILVQFAIALEHPRRSLKAANRSRSTPKTSSGSSSGSKKKEGWGFAEAGFGVVLIFIALPMIWMNERKDVKIYKVITKGRENVVEIDPYNPEDENEYKLVHA